MSSVSIADDDTPTHFKRTYLLAVVVCETDTLEKGTAREAAALLVVSVRVYYIHIISIIRFTSINHILFCTYVYARSVRKYYYCTTNYIVKVVTHFEMSKLPFLLTLSVCVL